MPITPLQLYGSLTAGYGAFLLVRPAGLLGPAGIRQTSSSEAVARAVGVRDLISGSALIAARTPVQRRRALALRVASDGGDVIGLGAAAAPNKANLVRVVASAWALVGILAWRSSDGPR